MIRESNNQSTILSQSRVVELRFRRSEHQRPFSFTTSKVVGLLTAITRYNSQQVNSYGYKFMVFEMFAKTTMCVCISARTTKVHSNHVTFFLSFFFFPFSSLLPSPILLLIFSRVVCQVLPHSGYAT